jgi:uncharacterized protein
VLLFFDVGGSMDRHVRACEELFSAARSEFKVMEYFYFHNCLYEHVWKENRRRWQARTLTRELLNSYTADYRVIFIGDAAMSPYELTMPGGSVEHMNEEPGVVWLSRLLGLYERAIWLNPVPERHWQYTHSIAMVRQIFSDRMFPLTVDGVDRAMRELAR